MSHSTRWLRSAALVLALSGCHRAGPPERDGRACAEAFLAAIRGGQVEPAWQSTSDEFKSIMGLGSFLELVAQHPALRSEAVYDSTVTRDSEGLSLAECVFHATPPASGRKTQALPTTIKVLLSAPDAEWKVDHLALE
jgi:hypothetical protein